jgi:hypothetical protein
MPSGVQDKVWPKEKIKNKDKAMVKVYDNAPVGSIVQTAVRRQQAEYVDRSASPGQPVFS